MMEIYYFGINVLEDQIDIFGIAIELIFIKVSSNEVKVGAIICLPLAILAYRLTVEPFLIISQGVTFYIYTIIYN